MARHLGLVLHVQQGNGGLSGWFNNPAARASSTWWVSKTGVLEQYVDGDVCAWAQGTGNSTYNSVETEGYVTEPLTPAAETTLARLYAWGVTTYRWPLALTETPGVPGFAWHGMGGAAWGGHTGCPGDLRKNRRQHILNAAGATPPPAPKPPTPSTAQTGENMILVDPKSGGTWCVASREGAVYTVGGAPYLGATNNTQMNAARYPCVGIGARPGDDGYRLVLDWGAGQGDMSADGTGKRFRTYDFPRNGSGKATGGTY
jgi:hypothetical protein